MTVQPTRDQLRAHLRRLIAAWDGPGNPSVSTADLAQLLDQADQAEARIDSWEKQYTHDLEQADAHIDAAEARIKAVRDVLDEPDAMVGTRLHVSVDRILHALESVTPPGQ